MEFAGKVALITGGGGGIGRASAIGFAGRGAKVVVVDLDATAGEASAELLRQRGGDARFVRADVTKSAEVQNYVKATLDAYGAIDCFFNNAGIEGRMAPTQEYDEAIFDAVIGVNLKGVFLGLRHVLPVMLKQGRGPSSTPHRPRRCSADRAWLLTSLRSTVCWGSPRWHRPTSRASDPGERGMPGAGRDAHDAIDRSAAESERPASSARYDRCRHADGPLCDARGSGQCGDVSLLGLRRRHHWHAHRY